MPGARDDYLLRMIQQAAAALRRLRERLGGGGAAEEVAHDAGAAIGALLGPRRELFERLDPRSAAQLLGDPERVALWADLLAVRADALEATSDATGAARLRERVNALRAAVPVDVTRRPD
jgi:hypothetical protein